MMLSALNAFLANDFFGNIEPPPGVNAYPSLEEGGIMMFASNIVRLIIVGGGLFTFMNILLAGYGFMSAGGDPKKIEQAWAKIWQSILGLGIMVFSFLIAALIGWILFRDVTAILNPKLYGPNVPK